MYSWEPIENFFAGGSVSYQLLDGLKEKFSYAKSLFRDTEVNIGLAYRFWGNTVIGANIIYFDEQESIEASDVNLFEVELFYYRGDKYFVSKRSSSMTGKIRKQGVSLGTQFFWEDGEKFSVGAQLNYSPSNSKILKPYSTTGQSFDEVEDSYADFKSLDIQIKSQYKISDELMAGGYAGYFNNKSWSKISLKELLMWEWKVNQVKLGAGVSYQVSVPLLIACEYEYSNGQADSSKYIDKRTNEVTTNDHELRIGAEYKLTDEVLFRGGVKFGTKQFDLVLGGIDGSYYKLSGGFSFPLFDVIIVDTNLQYLRSNSGNNNLTRNYLAGSIGITLTTF
jgi:opacity protein-like surface antigen